MKKIIDIATQAGISEEAIELYGNYKAKIDPRKLNNQKKGKLILVTSITPTKSGNGKTVSTISLAMGLKQSGQKVIAALREPSLGPNFGMKGGATGGGYAEIEPADDINLHFNGDFHAITTANNMLVAFIENYKYYNQGKPHGIKSISLKRCLDVNDRSLRYINTGLNGSANGIPNETGFNITPASDLMAIVCLSENLDDLQQRIRRMIVGYTYEGNAVTPDTLGVTGAITALLKDAIKPNLVQTIEDGAVMIHGGPFANIAHGCNSVIATKTALGLADYVVTEAGFASDLGAEKFFNIKCRYAGLQPALSVLVVTVKALKLHGGANEKELNVPNVNEVKAGLWNLERHVEILKSFGQKVLVVMNHFPTDAKEEQDVIESFCTSHQIPFTIHYGYAQGGKGCMDYAQKVIELTQTDALPIKHTYALTDGIKEKIEKVATTIYGAGKVKFSAQAEKQIQQITAKGLHELAICMAKTQYSFTDQATVSGKEKGFTIHVDQLNVNAGAGFIVVQCGEIMLMPGLPKEPQALQIHLEGDEVVGIKG
jgi:formate--tetrahydrofolate ligase